MKRTLLPVILRPAPRLPALLAAFGSLSVGFAVLLIYSYFLDSAIYIRVSHNVFFITLITALGFFASVLWYETKNAVSITQIEVFSGFTVRLWRTAQAVDAQWVACQRGGRIAWLRLRVSDASLGSRSCTVWLVGNAAASCAMRRWLTLRSLHPSLNQAEEANEAAGVRVAEHRA